MPTPRERPTEYAVAVFAAIVVILSGLGVALDERVVAGGSTLVALVVTAFASRPSNTLGPQ